MTTKAIAMMMAVLVACALTSATATKAPGAVNNATAVVTAMNNTASVAYDLVPPLEDIPTSLSFRALPSGRALTQVSWEWQSPWGGMVSGTWGGGGGGGATGRPRESDLSRYEQFDSIWDYDQQCSCGGCSQHVYLPPGNNYCAPSRQWCYFDVQNGAGACGGARQGTLSGRWLRCC